MSEAVLNNIKTRRVVREMTDERVTREQIETILEAARWAPSGGNLRPNRYIVIENAETRRLIRMASPGMFQKAPVLILICTSGDVLVEHQSAAQRPRPADRYRHGGADDDAGGACHRLGIGTGHLLQQGGDPRDPQPAGQLFAGDVHLHRA